MMARFKLCLHMVQATICVLLAGSLAQVPQGKKRKTTDPAAVGSTPLRANERNDAAPAVAASSGKKRKLLDLKTMLLVAGGNQNVDPVTLGVLHGTTYSCRTVAYQR